MIGIIGAMAVEVDYLKNLLQERKTEVHGGVEFCTGRVGGKDVVVAMCGIGKVFAAICAQTMINFYHPDVIVNSGVAGAVSCELKVFDVVVAEKTCQHDMDTSALGDPVGLISGVNKVYFDCDERVRAVLESAAASMGINAVSGIIATGDKFVSDVADKKRISDVFNASACEMEGGSINQVCFVNKVPCGILRTISDGEGAETDYVTFSAKAANNAARIAERFIELW